MDSNHQLGRTATETAPPAQQRLLLENPHMKPRPEWCPYTCACEEDKYWEYLPKIVRHKFEICDFHGLGRQISRINMAMNFSRFPRGCVERTQYYQGPLHKTLFYGEEGSLARHWRWLALTRNEDGLERLLNAVTTVQKRYFHRVGLVDAHIELKPQARKIRARYELGRFPGFERKVIESRLS